MSGRHRFEHFPSFVVFLTAGCQGTNFDLIHVSEAAQQYIQCNGKLKTTCMNGYVVCLPGPLPAQFFDGPEFLTSVADLTSSVAICIGGMIDYAMQKKKAQEESSTYETQIFVVRPSNVRRLAIPPKSLPKPIISPRSFTRAPSSIASCLIPPS